MKKIVCIFATLLLVIACIPFGCRSNPTLSDYVSELQTEVYAGESENYALKASYGYTVSNEKIYCLTVKMTRGYMDNVTYSLSLEPNGKTFTEQFEINPVSSVLTAKIEVENLTDKQFTVTVSTASESETVTLNSIIPDGTADYKTAISSLLKSQPGLIENYYDGDAFNGSIAMRILVKNDKPYWYVGLVNESGDTKALLIDGITLKVLAIRDIF